MSSSLWGTFKMVFYRAAACQLVVLDAIAVFLAVQCDVLYIVACCVLTMGEDSGLELGVWMLISSNTGVVRV